MLGALSRLGGGDGGVIQGHPMGQQGSWWLFLATRKTYHDHDRGNLQRHRVCKYSIDIRFFCCSDDPFQVSQVLAGSGEPLV